jgi:hypothetical protein
MLSRSPRILKYRHYKPKNLAVVRIDGRDHYLGRFNSQESRERFGRLIAEWLTRCRSTQPRLDATGQPGSLTIDELILAFWKHAEKYDRSRDGKPTQELENMRDALCPLRKLYGSSTAGTFGSLALRAV